MTLRIDATPFLDTSNEDPDGPLLQMVVSLGFPGMNLPASNIQSDTTRRAFDAVREVGGRPRLVEYTTGHPLRPVGDVCEEADALVFLGGADVDPACYNYEGELPANLYGVDRRADEYCVSLLQEGASRDMPILAICRGSQVMNVAFGGTLIPDIEDWEMHKGPGNPLFIDEEVRLVDDSRIRDVMGTSLLTVRNGHHQAVDQVGPVLRATAYAHDGIVEATEHVSASWIVGVQWHPEEVGANLRDQNLIFSAIVEQARKARQTRQAQQAPLEA